MPDKTRLYEGSTCPRKQRAASLTGEQLRNFQLCLSSILSNILTFNFGKFFASLGHRQLVHSL